MSGVFGCASCRDRFAVEDGFGDFRPVPRESQGEPGDGARDEGGPKGEPGDGSPGQGGAGDRGDPASGRRAADAALRLAAALGVARGPGLLVVDDAFANEAAPLAGMVHDIEVVVVGWLGRGVAAGGGRRAGEGSPEGARGARRAAGPAGGRGVSAFVAGPALPLRDAVARGVAAAGRAGPGWWDECLRVLMPGGRVVIAGAPDAARAWARRAGLAVVLDEGEAEAGRDGMLVAALPMPGQGPKPMAWKPR